MVNEEQVEILKQGVEIWNKWRKNNPTEQVNLSGVDLSGADLSGAFFWGVDLSGANLGAATLSGADLSGANLSGANFNDAKLRGATLIGATLNDATLVGANLMMANLHDASLNEATLHNAFLNEATLTGAILVGADLQEVDLRGADLSRATLLGANCNDAILSGATLRMTNLCYTILSGAALNKADLSQADFSRADLSGADLGGAILLDTDLSGANLSRCSVCGISAWNLNLEETGQSDLVVSLDNEPIIVVDDLEMAQFIDLLLHNQKIRSVIDSITTKVVLILGCFTPERTATAYAIREELRQRDYMPIVLDFQNSGGRDWAEPVMTLASLSRFVIADLTDPNNIPLELLSFGESLLSIPIQVLFSAVPDQMWEYAPFKQLAGFPHVLPVFKYENQEQLIGELREKVIDPAEKKVEEIRSKLFS